jgi:excinuclease ABC subunit B
MDYFPEDFLVITDESHQTLPQIGGIARGDRSRKQTLIDWGFRLPGSLDNRPQTWEEFISNTPKLLALSATPGKWEEENASIVELLVRPTAIVDPSIATYSSKGQMQKLLEEIEKEISKNRRTLVTTLTKKMAERLSEYLIENGIKTTYLHSDILTLERLAILHKLRSGEIDVLVGVNLLREGLDLPEVGMVAILDADREGFLRGKSALIQTMGRAARNPEGRVLLFSEGQSGSMKAAIDEAERRRNLQLKYNKATGQTPQAIIKPLSVASELQEVFKKDGKSEPIIEEPILNNKIALEKAMLEAADELRFEEAGLLKKRLDKLIKSGN